MSLSLEEEKRVKLMSVMTIGRLKFFYGRWSQWGIEISYGSYDNFLTLALGSWVCGFNISSKRNSTEVE